MKKRYSFCRLRRSGQALALQFCCALMWNAAVANGSNAQGGVPSPVRGDTTDPREFFRRNLPAGVRFGDIVPDPSYPSGEVAHVYRAALDVLYYPPGKKPRLVVLREMTEHRWLTECRERPCPFLPPHQSRIDSLTLRAFRHANLTRRLVRPSFTYRIPLVVLSDHMQQTLYSIGLPLLPRDSTRIGGPFWLGFVQFFPGAWGYATVTQVGFNPARNEALLEVNHRCGDSCSSTEVMFLRKLKGVWRVVERIPEQETRFAFESGHKDLRDRGVAAQMPYAEARAEWVADSLKKTLLPRWVRGIVTDSATGAPLGAARLSVQGGGPTNTVLDYAISDSLGRYTVLNPPVGWGTISVHCPKSTASAGEVVSYASPMVRSSIDTTINFAVNLNRCGNAAQSDTAPSPRRLTSPPPPLLDSAEMVAALTSNYPSLEEAAIYTTVLNGMGGAGPGEVVLVANKTRTFCSRSDCADHYRRRIRSIPEVILSTLDDFLRVRENSISFRPDFTSQSALVSSYSVRRDVALIGEVAINYLQAQASFSDSAYLASREGYDLGYWETIHLAYPSVRQIVSFSRIAFSPRRRQALLQATRADINGLRETMFLLNYIDGEWRIARLF